MTASEGLPQGSDSTTRADTPAMATHVTSSMAGSTPLDGLVASTPSTTGPSPRSLRAPVCSAGRFYRSLSPALLTAHHPRQVLGRDRSRSLAQRLPPSVPAGRWTEDAVIIRNLPLHLADATRTWLEHLPADQIHDWADLVKIFVGNFQGTYVHPGNS